MSGSVSSTCGLRAQVTGFGRTCVVETRVQSSDVVADRLRRAAARATAGDERLHILGRDLGDRPLTEERDQVHRKRGLIRGERRCLATLRFEAADQPLAGLAHRCRRRRWRCLGHLDPPPQLGLGHLAGQTLAGPRLAFRSKLALDQAAVDAPLAVPAAVAREQRPGAVATALLLSHSLPLPEDGLPRPLVWRQRNGPRPGEVGRPPQSPRAAPHPMPHAHPGHLPLGARDTAWAMSQENVEIGALRSADALG